MLITSDINHFYVLQNELWMCINSTLPGKQVKPRHPDADLLLYLTTNQNKICLQTVAPASVGAAHVTLKRRSESNTRNDIYLHNPQVQIQWGNCRVQGKNPGRESHSHLLSVDDGSRKTIHGETPVTQRQKHTGDSQS